MSATGCCSPCKGLGHGCKNVTQQIATLYHYCNLKCTQFYTFRRSVYSFNVTRRPVSSTAPMLLLWGSLSSALILWPRTSASSARLVMINNKDSPKSFQLDKLVINCLFQPDECETFIISLISAPKKAISGYQYR